MEKQLEFTIARALFLGTSLIMEVLLKKLLISMPKTLYDDSPVLFNLI